MTKNLPEIAAAAQLKTSNHFNFAHTCISSKSYTLSQTHTKHSHLMQWSGMPQMWMQSVLKLNESFGTNVLATHPTNVHALRTSTLMVSQNSNTLTQSSTNAQCACAQNKPRNQPEQMQPAVQLVHFEDYWLTLDFQVWNQRTKSVKKIRMACMVKPVGC